MRKLHDNERSVLESRPLVLVPTSMHTLDPDVDGEAVLVFGSRIAAVGTVVECTTAATRLSGQEPEVRRLDGVLVPGFIDPHAHPLMFGQMLSWVDCGPEHASTIPEIVALLRAAAATTPAGQPIRGYGYEHRNLAEQRHPTRFELDGVSADREVYLMNASGHGGVVNSHTLAAAGVTRDTPDPDGGVFFRDEDGEMTTTPRWRGCLGAARRGNEYRTAEYGLPAEKRSPVRMCQIRGASRPAESPIRILMHGPLRQNMSVNCVRRPLGCRWK